MDVISIRKNKYGTISVTFKKGEKRGKFGYSFFGEESGIEWCEYKEDDDEDIYADIHDWVEEHIKAELRIKYNGKEL